MDGSLRALGNDGYSLDRSVWCLGNKNRVGSSDLVISIIISDHSAGTSTLYVSLDLHVTVLVDAAGR